jgi:hypothetical protein
VVDDFRRTEDRKKSADFGMGNGEKAYRGGRTEGGIGRK